MGKKLIEIDQHLKHLDRQVEIRALMARYRDDRTMTRKLEAELQSLKDADRRMSIWPLIEAGEFSTISEGLTELDGLARKKWRAPTEEPGGVLWETGTDRRRSFGVKRCGLR